MTKKVLCWLFWLCETFFCIFYCIQRVPLSISFSILQHKKRCSKTPKAPPFLHFPALCNFPQSKKTFEKKVGFFFNFFLMRVPKKRTFDTLKSLSLRYGANLGRSGLFMKAPTKKRQHPKPRPLTEVTK